MLEVEHDSIDVVITSPPYWNIKDYGVDGQIGHGQSLHEYLKNLFLVWKECFRVLKGGTRLCINIGDQFLRSVDYGRYRIIPIHAELTNQCINIGFDYMGSIIWQKKTTMNPTGGGVVMGSYPYPPNGLIEFDYEHILIFKKPGKRKVSIQAKEESILTKEEWKTLFSGHWNFAGERQRFHEAMFPEELPARLIKMFTFVNDVVLDPFLGSGTTTKASIALDRNSVGYELNEGFLSVIEDKIGVLLSPLVQTTDVEIIRRSVGNDHLIALSEVDYSPNIPDLVPIVPAGQSNYKKEKLYKVAKILNENTVELNTGLEVELLGASSIVAMNGKTRDYLEEFIKGKQVFLKFDPLYKMQNNRVQGYLYLKNRIFVNKELVRMGLSKVPNYEFKYREKFKKLESESTNG